MKKLEFLTIQHATQNKLLAMNQALDLADIRGQENEMVDPKVAALITEFDTATDKIATRIQNLINAGGLSADSSAALQAEVDKLNLLGQDPANPVPPATAV